MSDALLFLGCWLVLGIVAAVLFGRHARRTAARDQLPDMPDSSPADLDALELLWDLPTYSGGDHTTTNPTGDQTP
ncbi:hypothetical protein QBA79_36510 [Streptomyces scabiei]|uniref:hypothetical protein n=1 Tax=Streptomyces scabiei TaxID=1930 RepID=UPI001B308816|nr:MULTISPECIES: hypothetical protein [Streptomyces]MBP5870906.1 hypothetical protein [Streptomyces sp. LBUM 1485]MDX2532339.1 hypothetical protein [Streptomyces scabiei]QTU57390.1 hypothetical protein F3K21_35205 [Streptomyces sp. LBUM 1480]